MPRKNYFSKSAFTQRRSLTASILQLASDYATFVDSTGNECAFTDRKCMEIVDLAEKLKQNLLLPKKL